VQKEGRGAPVILPLSPEQLEAGREIPGIERFEDLETWQQARKLANTVYDLSNVGAFARDFALRDQIRRAAVSIMSNIAEGFESRTQSLYIEHLGRAKASCGEVRSQLYLAYDRQYMSGQVFEQTLAQAESASRLILLFDPLSVKQQDQRNARRCNWLLYHRMPRPAYFICHICLP
jgi:four helix bundle protein